MQGGYAARARGFLRECKNFYERTYEQKNGQKKGTVWRALFD